VLSEARVFITPDDSSGAVEIRVDAKEESDMSNIFKNLPAEEEGP
jgi:hypothetical protein